MECFHSKCQKQNTSDKLKNNWDQVAEDLMGNALAGHNRNCNAQIFWTIVVREVAGEVVIPH